MPARVVHQDAAHHACGDREELDAVLPPYAAEIHEPDVGLMDESCGCQRMIAAFGTETPARDPPQVFVHGLHQSAVCGRIPLAPRHEPPGHVILGHTLLRGPECTTPRLGATDNRFERGMRGARRTGQFHRTGATSETHQRPAPVDCSARRWLMPSSQNCWTR